MTRRASSDSGILVLAADKGIFEPTSWSKNPLCAEGCEARHAPPGSAPVGEGGAPLVRLRRVQREPVQARQRRGHRQLVQVERLARRRLWRRRRRLAGAPGMRVGLIPRPKPNSPAPWSHAMSSLRLAQPARQMSCERSWVQEDM